MRKLSDYTTDELTRLTTLTEDTLKQGEYGKPSASRIGVALRLEDGQVAFHDGSCRHAQPYAPIRRVTSFTDPTELDPPQADMLAELRRRERPMPNNVEHGGRKVKTWDDRIHTLLDAESAARHQKGWEAEGFEGQFVWAVNARGHILGHYARDWELLDF